MSKHEHVCIIVDKIPALLQKQAFLLSTFAKTHFYA